jgi:hypothetical protein
MRLGAEARVVVEVAAESSVDAAEAVPPRKIADSTGYCSKSHLRRHRSSHYHHLLRKDSRFLVRNLMVQIATGLSVPAEAAVEPARHLETATAVESAAAEAEAGAYNQPNDAAGAVSYIHCYLAAVQLDSLSTTVQLAVAVKAPALPEKAVVSETDSS